MKKILIAAVAATSLATSLAVGISVAQADGTDALETQLFRDRGANIVAPEDIYAPVPYSAQPRRFNQQGFVLLAPLDGYHSRH